MASPTNAGRLLSINEERGTGAGPVEDEQLVLVYCQGEQERADVAVCCHASQRPKRRHQKLEVGNWKKWQPMLQSGIPKIPPPYTMADREAFWVDAGTFLDASLLASRTGRWPPLLVTDNENLCQVAAMGHVRSKLAEVAQIRDTDLLTVVMAADFGHLCGVLISGSPLDQYEPLVSEAESNTAKAERTFEPSTEVKVPCGVFVQRLHLVTIGEAADPACRFGARCVALFSDGRAAYCAISPDGSRSVEAAGRWQTINGQVVIYADGPNQNGAHLQLSKLNAQLLPEISYEQPIFISLEELMSDFESPISLAECIPRGGHLLRLQLLEEGVPTTIVAPRSSEAAVLSSALDATFNTAWDAASDTGKNHLTVNTDTPKAVEPEGKPQEPRAYFLRTPIHALLSLANASPVQENPDQKPAGPRLFGIERGITTSLPPPAEIGWDQHASAKAESSDAFLQGIRRLPTGRGLPIDEAAQASFQTCAVKPGLYFYEVGQPKDYSYKKLVMKLHVDGKCDYKESVQGRSLRTTSPALWQMESDILILNSPKSGSSFILRESRGSKSMERKVAKITVPMFVVKRCRYTSFDQHMKPFQLYKPMPESSLIFGVVDPESPALRGLRCRPDHLPYHAFERELRRQGLPVDEILTDFRFIDRDADGLVSVDDMRRLETYGNPFAAPEILEELREALVRNFGNLSAAFEALSATAGAGRVTQDEFANFFQALDEASAQPGSGRPLVAAGDRGQPLRTWLSENDADSRAAVFGTLCPDGDAIELADFLSLNIHGASLALRRLEHFQAWIFEGFGRSGEVLRKVFKAMGPAEGRGLSRKALFEGAQALGYPCEMRVIRSVFSLLDRNFDGEVSAREFQKLLDFNSEDVLREVEALKRFADTMLGGVEAAFAKFLERERILQGLPASPKTTSYDAFHKVCVQAGFNKLAPKADLRMLFLFLNEVSGRQTAGFLSFSEWSLLKGFNSKAISGSPARLRRILQESYGSVDMAFQRMHTSWLRRALVKGLRQTALAGLVHSVLNPTAPERSPSRVAKKPLLSSLRGQSPLHGNRPPLGSRNGTLQALPPRARSTDRAPSQNSQRRSTGRSTPPLPPLNLSSRPPSAALLNQRHKPIGLMPDRKLPGNQTHVSAVDWGPPATSSPV